MTSGTLQPVHSEKTADKKVGTASESTPSVWTTGGSQQHLVEVQRPVIFKQTSRKRLELLLGIAITIILLLAASLCILTYVFATMDWKGVNTCYSAQCIRSASNLLESMDTSIDPCDDFYKYTCGRWNKEHVRSDAASSNNWFLDRSWLVERDVREYLTKNNTPGEPLSVHQARDMYTACLDFKSMEKVGLERLWQLLDDIGLPRNPFSSGEPKQSWVVSLAKARRILGLDLLVGSGLMPLPHNHTIYRLVVATAMDPEPLPGRFLQNRKIDKMLKKKLEEGTDDTIKTFKKYATDIIQYFIKANNESVKNNSDKVEQMAEGIVILMKNISTIEESENVTGFILNETPEEMTIEELQAIMDDASPSGVSKFNWTEYFISMYEDIDVELDLEGEDTILVYKRAYFEMISEYLEEADEKSLELLVWWKVVYSVASHTNEDLSDLKNNFIFKVLGGRSGSARSLFCMETVYNIMYIAIGYQVISNPIIENKKAKVSEMLGDMKSVFTNLIKKLSWMDDKTKKATIEKVNAIQEFISYPEWMKDQEEMDTLYGDVNITKTTHLDNVLSIIYSQVDSQLASLRIPYNNTIAHFDPLDINAYYSPSDNAITVPEGILQFPFYDLGLEALNYGAIGAILGHELTHGFDNTGRKYDKEGNLNDWWSAEAVKEYNKRASCYVDKYDTFYIEAINKTVDGNLTLGENLADNGGLREALYAYREYIKKHGKELALPGFHNFSSEQLFFLSYGNIWCSEYTTSSLATALHDEHSPQFVRVIAALQNFPEFSSAWKCQKGSHMNPEKKCKLWVD